MTFKRWFVVLAAVFLGALSGCKKEGTGGGKGPTTEQIKENTKTVGGMGKLLAKGTASELRLSPNGKVASYLTDADKPRLDGIPPQMRIGELWAVPVEGGEPRKLGNGVTNMPGGWLFSADGRWALLMEGYNAALASGNLIAVDLTSAKWEPVTLGSNVTYMLAAPDSKNVAFVSGGILKVGPLPNGPFRDVAGEVSTTDFTPDSQQLLFRRRLNAAGGLFLTPVASGSGKPEAPKKLGDYVGDYLVSPDGKHIAFAQRSDVSPSYKDLFVASAPEFKSKKVATQTNSFAYSPDSKYLAWTEGFKTDAELGDLFVGTPEGADGHKVGDKVGPFTFAPDSKAIAYLEYYDYSARSGPNSYGGAGVLGRTTLPDGKPRRIGNRVPNYAWAADSKYIAFLSRFLKPVYSVDLMLYADGADSAVKVKSGAFGYLFGPKDSYVLYRSNCIRDGRACDLYQADPAKLMEVAPKVGTQTEAQQASATGTPPPPQPIPEEQVLQGLYTFAPSKDGSRLVVTYPRWESKNFDVAVYNVKTKQRKALDAQILIPALFTDDQGSHVVYIVNDGERSGVYVAMDVP